MKILSVGDKEKIAFLDKSSVSKETYFSTYKYVPVSLDGYFLADYTGDTADNYAASIRWLRIAGGGCA